MAVLPEHQRQGIGGKLIETSKYKNAPGFGTKFKTPILLQDHGEEIWFRNLKILPLPRIEGTRN